MQEYPTEMSYPVYSGLPHTLNSRCSGPPLLYPVAISDQKEPPFIFFDGGFRYFRCQELEIQSVHVGNVWHAFSCLLCPTSLFRGAKTQHESLLSTDLVATDLTLCVFQTCGWTSQMQLEIRGQLVTIVLYLHLL